MSQYKLTYFQARGRGEPIRLMFAAAEQKFEDFRVNEYIVDYKEAFATDKQIPSEEWKALKKKLPFGRVPVLEVDGRQIGQLKVIMSFLGKRFGLAGSNEWEETQVAMITEATEDFFMIPTFEMFLEQDKKAEQIKKYAMETLPADMHRLERMVGEKGYFVGDKLSYADIAFYFHCSWPAYIKVDVDLSKFPKLKGLCEKVESNPGIAKWLKERPKTDF